MSTPFSSRWLPLDSGNEAGVRTAKTDRSPPLVSEIPQGYEPPKPTEAPELRQAAAFVGFDGANPPHVSKTEGPAWPPCGSCGRTSGFTYSDQDPTVRCLCGEPRPALPDSPVCLDCRRPVTPNDLFCDGCFQSRKVIPLEELARRREERRKRTEARLRSTPCGSCGRTGWEINARGDAFCRACFPARRTR